VAGPPDSPPNWMAEWRQGEAPGLVAPAIPDAAAAEVRWRVVAAAGGLAIAGVSAPVAVTAMAATNMLLGPPLVAAALVGLLALMPIGVGLATALAGAGRVAMQAARAGNEAELAVLRVVLDTLLFGYMLAMAATAPQHGAAAEYLPIAAAALVAAWTLLLCVIQWPVASPLRRYGAMAFDVALFSAFLHFGGGAVAGWYPFYLLMIFYAGLRFGLVALLVVSIVSVLGFTGVILSTEIWRLQPALTGGLLVALAVLPACLAGMIHALAAARAKATGAEAERQTTLQLIADTLSGPPVTARATREVPLHINDIVDFAALEAGRFGPPLETFDLRALVRCSLIPLQAKAAERGIALRWRVDPTLPYRLRGHAQVLGRILSLLADHALEVAQMTTIRLAVECAAGDAQHVQLKLRVDGLDAPREPVAPGDAIVLSLRLVQRLVAMVGGAFVSDRLTGDRVRLTVTLPLAIERGSAARVLDLGHRPVLIAAADNELAGILVESLTLWNAQVSRPGDIETALAEISRREPLRPVLIVDGRDKLLSALSLAHRMAGTGDDAPLVVLIASAAQIASLGEVEEAGLDGFIPAPVTELLLANALDALPLLPGRPAPPVPLAPPSSAVTQPPTSDAAVSIDERITPIAAHPKFVPEALPAVDARVIEGLYALGGDPAFIDELAETFRADARQVMQRIAVAAAAADEAGFARGIGALQRAAGPLGATQLCELLASLQGLTAGELRQRGAADVLRLDGEIERFSAALLEFAPANEAQQR
jgi:hypothetical protein